MMTWRRGGVLSFPEGFVNPEGSVLVAVVLSGEALVHIN
jgi:hypothetical protein